MLKKSRSLSLIVVAALVILISAALPAEAQRRQPPQQELPKKEFTNVKVYWHTPVKSQGRTGTCWSFSTVSFLESEANRINGVEYELSEMYYSYLAYFGKADSYIRLHGNNNFGAGALAHDVFDGLRTHGALRDEDFSGMWPNETVHNHSEMHAALQGYLDGVLKARRPTGKWMKGFKAALEAYMLAPPIKISVDGTEMTPKEFADNVLGLKAEDYLLLTSFSYLPYYEQVEPLFSDNWSHNDDYYNLPLDDFMAVMNNAVENGFTVAIGGDVSEATFNQGKWGYGIVEQDKEDKVVTVEEREAGWDNWSSSDDHGMHTVGYATDENGKRFYYTKNSWGQKSGPYNGYCYFSENFIRSKMHTLVMHKDAVPAEIRDKMGIK